MYYKIYKRVFSKIILSLREVKAKKYFLCYWLRTNSLTKLNSKVRATDAFQWQYFYWFLLVKSVLNSLVLICCDKLALLGIFFRDA